MPVQAATYTFQDLSGPTTTSNSTDSNPYRGLIEACNDDPAQIQARYNTHRTLRTTQQRELLLSPDFPGMNIDPILVGILLEEERAKAQYPQTGNDWEAEKAKGAPVAAGTTIDGGASNPLVQQDTPFVDHRHNFSFWARPPEKVRILVGECQRRLREVVPDLWLMPLDRLHMTTLEIFDSRDADAVAATKAQLEPLIPIATDIPYTLQQHPTISSPTSMKFARGTKPNSDRTPVLNAITAIRALSPLPSMPKRARLVNPMLSYDATAVALTWVPAAAEGADAYTYHHLRRDMWELLSETSQTNEGLSVMSADVNSDEIGYSNGGRKHEPKEQATPRMGPVAVKSRYVVPSAHLTIARNINRWDIMLDDDASRTAHTMAETGYSDDNVDRAKVAAFVAALDEMNAWLKREFWVDSGLLQSSAQQTLDTEGQRKTPMQWIIGEEKGLDCRCGRSWFGGGETIRLGKGF